MRHVSLLIIAILSLSFITAQSQISFGPVASLNIATQQWKGNFGDNFKLTPLIRFQAGGFANYKVNEKFGAQAELIYSSEGTGEKNKVFGGSGYISFGFVRLPLSAQYYITEQFHVEAGPNIGVLIGGKEKWNGESEKIDLDDYKKIDAGLSIGAGYDLSEFIKGITAGLRFYYGFTNMVRTEDLNGGGFKNRVISVNVRYAIPFSNK
jgi:hypothetical protein